MSWFLVLKLKNGLNSREFKRKKAKARALTRETEGETARKSKSRPAAYRQKRKKMYAVVLENGPQKYRYSRVSLIDALK